MGSHNSSRSSSKNGLSPNKKNDKQFIDSNLFITSQNINDDSSSRGFYDSISFNSSQTNPSKSKSSLNENNSSSSANPFIMLPTKFEWNEGGKEVFLLGKFSGNDLNKQQMEYDPNTKIFSTLLFLNKGNYEFKFIVDGNSALSKKYQIIKKENGEEFNCLDNSIEILKMGKNKIDDSNKSNLSPTETNISPPETPNLLREETENSQTNSINPSVIPKENTPKDHRHHNKDQHQNNDHHSHKEGNQRKNIKNKEGKSSGKIPYGTIFPNRNKLSLTAPSIPQAYSSTLSMDLQKDKILEGDNYASTNYPIENYFPEYKCDSYKKINVPYHVNINHLLIKSEQYDNFFSINSTIRVGRKFCTLIFCNPYENNESNSQDKNNKTSKDNKKINDLNEENKPPEYFLDEF